MDFTGSLLLLVKATLLLGIAFIAVYWQRTAPASRRHGVWSTTFVALLALPLLVVILPAIRVPVPASLTTNRPASEVNTRTSGSELAPRDVTKDIAGTSGTTTEPSAPVSSPNPWTRGAFTATPFQVLMALWLGGVCLALLAMARSLYRVRRLAASGNGVTDTALNQAADHIARKLGLASRPSLVLSDKVSSPMAGHIAGPIIFLPSDATQWDAERRDIVLAHEMTHLARRDPFRILAARAACGLYWFHPLMWVAARRFAADCEQACDENVLALGIRPSTYARVLMDFANTPPTPVPSLALPIVNRHRLETRLMAILANADRRPVSARRALLSTFAAAGVIVAIAAAQPTPAEAVTPAMAKTPAIEASAPSLAPKAEVTANTETVRPNVTIASQRGSCWSEGSGNRNFNGSSTISGGRVIQRIGRSGRERVAQMTFGDLRVCMVTEGYEGSEMTTPSEWIGDADRIVLETERDNDVRQLEINDSRTTFTINGRSAAMDDGVRAWRSALLDVLDASWEVNMLRGQESSLRGEISSTLGERSSLLGQISSLRGQVSSMLGEISSLRGQESSLRGEISSIRGHESSLRGQISSERGSISSLESQRWERNGDRDAIASRVRRHQDRIRELEDEIARYDADARVREVERRIDEHATDRQVAAVERRVREFDVESKVAAIEREIANLGVDRRIRGIENEIDALNVDTRAADINTRRDRALDRLRSVLGSR